MKRIWILALAAALCMSAAGCGASGDSGDSEDGSASEDSGALIESSQDDGASQQAAQPTDLSTLEIVLPEEYEDLLLVTRGDLEDLDGNHEVSLITVQEKASAEALEQDLGYSYGGFLFGIMAVDQIGFEQRINYDFIGCDVIARDGYWYYMHTYPTDVQFYRTGENIIGEGEEWEQWMELSAMGDTVCADFISRNGLTPYSQNELLDRPYLWDGEHAYIRYKEDQYIFILSQPATAGEGGIWWVEQIVDVYGTRYFHVPKSDGTAAEYFAALQARCDQGEESQWLTPLGTAMAFVEDSIWYQDVAKEENLEICDESVLEDFSRWAE